MDFLIPGLRHFLVLGSILFALGMYGALSRRNAIGILLSIELMLNGVNLLMVAFARYLTTTQELAGQMFAIFMTPGQIDVPGLVGRGQRLGALLVSGAVGAISIWVVITTPWKIRDTLLDIPTAEAIGGLMLTRYVLPFEIASLLLTVALIGAIVIAREE